MKLFDDMGNEVTGQYVHRNELEKLKAENCCLQEEVAKLSKGKKKKETE